MGRNCPAEAMPFNGMVRRYLIIYIVNLLLKTNQCQQRSSADYALGVTRNTLHIPGTIANFSPLARTPIRQHIGKCLGDEFGRLILSAYTQFDLSCCWTKIALPVPLCISPFTFIHDPFVMITICHQRIKTCFLCNGVVS